MRGRGRQTKDLKPGLSKSGIAVMRKTKSPEVSRRSGLRGKHECAMALCHRPPGGETVPDLLDHGRREAVRTRAGAWFVQQKVHLAFHFQAVPFVLR
jgi:hypothetical protein